MSTNILRTEDGWWVEHNGMGQQHRCGRLHPEQAYSAHLDQVAVGGHRPCDEPAAAGLDIDPVVGNEGGIAAGTDGMVDQRPRKAGFPRTRRARQEQAETPVGQRRRMQGQPVLGRRHAQPRGKVTVNRQPSPWRPSRAPAAAAASLRNGRFSAVIVPR